MFHPMYSLVNALKPLQDEAGCDAYVYECVCLCITPSLAQIRT